MKIRIKSKKKIWKKYIINKFLAKTKQNIFSLFGNSNLNVIFYNQW